MRRPIRQQGKNQLHLSTVGSPEERVLHGGIALTPEVLAWG